MVDTLRVLHVDDEPDFADMVADFIEQENDSLDVETATSANEGLEKLATTDFDCIVSDFDMPGQNGIEFLTSVREDHPGLPFILFTGKGSEEVASDAISAGVTDYLQKKSGVSQYTVLAHRIANAVDRYRSRREVEATEEKLLQLAEKTEDILFMVNSDWSEVLFINSAYESIFGRPVAELKDDPTSFLTGIHPDDREAARQSMERLTNGESTEIEYRVTQPQGDQRWIRGESKPLFDDSGSVSRIAGFVRDITAQKEQDWKQEQIIERVTDAIVEVDADWTFTLVNEQAEELYDMSEEYLLGRNFWEVFPEALDSRFEEEYRHVMETREPTSFVEYYSGLDGWFDIKAYPKNDGGIAFYFIEVTEQRTRQLELERENERFQYVEKVADIGYWEIDTRTPEPHDVFLSDGVYHVHDLSPEEPFDVEKGIQFYHPEDRPIVREAVDKAINEGESYDHVVRLITATGSERWVHSVGEPIVRDGEIVKVHGVFQDVTDSKRNEEALTRQNERLEEFASIVSHDLRNPLNLAAGRLKLVREEIDNDHLESIDKALDRMERIIDDVLWLAREGRDIGSTEPVAFRNVIEGAWAIVADDKNESELVIRGDHGEDPPTLKADYDRLCQLIENLLRNAIEHGGDGVTVTAGVLDDGFYIEDDGPGVPESEREAVFDSGYSTTSDGTGFGLSIVKRVAEAHGWDVSVTDGEDGGARFEITDVTILNE